MRLDLFVHFANGDDISKALAHILKQGKDIMASLDDVKAALAQAAADATAEKAEVAAAIQALNDKIAELQALIAAGTNVTSADLDALVAQITSIDAAVKDITVPAALA